MKKALVIGANSFLGKALILRLGGLYEITGVYHVNAGNLVNGVNNIPITQLGTLSDDFDLVFIISAYIPGKDETEAAAEKLLQQTNVELPQQICAQFQKARIIYASSVSVYGDVAGVIAENTVCVPASAYGKSKLSGETIVKQHAAYSIVRISSMYGEGMKPITFIPLVINAALQQKQVVLLGQGGRLQNYIHVGDVAEIFIRSARQFTNNTYLAVAEKSYSNLEIASCIKEALPEVKIVLQGTDSSRSFEYNGSYTFARLNYFPQKNIGTGIRELIEWKKRMF